MPRPTIEPQHIIAARKVLEKYEAGQDEKAKEWMAKEAGRIEVRRRLENLDAGLLNCPFCGEPAFLEESAASYRILCRSEERCLAVMALRIEPEDRAKPFERLKVAEKLCTCWNTRTPSAE
jgi:hypothetical protein